MTYASAYTTSEKPVSCTTRLNFEDKSSVAASPPVAFSRSIPASSVPSIAFRLASCRIVTTSSTWIAVFARSAFSFSARLPSSNCIMALNASCVSTKNVFSKPGVDWNSESDLMQPMMRSTESSSICDLQNADVPTRMMDVQMSIASPCHSVSILSTLASYMMHTLSAFVLALSDEISACRITSFVKVEQRTVAKK